MSYERNLTFNLRLRGLSEPEIAEVLDEVRAHEAATGTPAEAEFGTAEEYAKQFPKKKRRTRGSTITMIGAALAIAYALFAVLLAILFRVDIREYVGPITLLPGLVLILASVVAGFLTDYFQPVQGSRAARQGS
jgi:sterol desaturase/sphingolipid hydroxylase (fatty acid hydroxylase superfamily)